MRVVDDLELAADELHGEVDLAALEQLEARRVGDHLRHTRSARGVIIAVFDEGEYGVVLADAGLGGRGARSRGRRDVRCGFGAAFGCGFRWGGGCFGRVLVRCSGGGGGGWEGGW